MSSNLRDTTMDMELSPSRDLKVINQRLMDLRKKGKVHLIGPGVNSLVKLEVLPESYQVSWHCFMFDPMVGGPHIYHDKRWDDGVVALKREALLELWASADGKFLHCQRDDDGMDRHYARYTVGGSVLTLSGIPKTDAAPHEIDLRQGSEATKGISDGQLRQQRINISMICEAKAQNRIIRRLLGISQSYTQEQISWPFVLMKLIFVADMKDPMTRFLVTANAIGAAGQLFGGSAGPELLRQLLAPAPDREEPAALPPASERQALTDGNGNGGASTEAAKLPFELIEDEKPKFKQIQTLSDYSALEAAAKGQSTPELVAAIEDLRVRYAAHVLKVNTPIAEWKPGERRLFVEKLFEKLAKLSSS